MLVLGTLFSTHKSCFLILLKTFFIDRLKLFKRPLLVPIYILFEGYPAAAKEGHFCAKGFKIAQGYHLGLFRYTVQKDIFDNFENGNEYVQF